MTLFVFPPARQTPPSLQTAARDGDRPMRTARAGARGR